MKGRQKGGTEGGKGRKGRKGRKGGEEGRIWGRESEKNNRCGSRRTSNL